jgi:subtilisin family serine protease
MRKSLVFALALLIGALGARPALADALVRLKSSLNPVQEEALSTALGSLGAKVVWSSTSVSGLVQVALPSGTSIPTASAALQKSGAVQYVESDYTRLQAGHSMRLKADPPPPIPAPVPAPAQWIDDPEEGLQYGVVQNGASQVWRTKGAIGDPSISIAVIDTGIDYTHPDLVGNLWRNGAEIGYDFVNSLPNPWDDGGHGTHVAGIAAAVGGNGIGISGQCPRCSLMALKALDSRGAGHDSDILKALDYALKHGASVAILAWGGPDDSQALHDGLQAASDAGLLLVAAAGNDGVDLSFGPYYPARYKIPALLSVAALYDSPVSMPFWSNYGVPYVHLSSAGSDVHSTWPGGKMVLQSGTSMAAAQVAGAAALIRSYRPKLKATDIVNLLKTVTGDPDSAARTAFGGRPDLVKIFSNL